MPLLNVILMPVPVLHEYGLAITTAFYKNLFTAYPELKILFSVGNQANGSQQQSLASAVFAYGTIFLASDKSSFMTGADLAIGGSYTCPYAKLNLGNLNSFHISCETASLIPFK